MTKPLSLEKIESARFEKWWKRTGKRFEGTRKGYALKAWLARARKDTSK